jgi:hypothetical protein
LLGAVKGDNLSILKLIPLLSNALNTFQPFLNFERKFRFSSARSAYRGEYQCLKGSESILEHGCAVLPTAAIERVLEGTTEVPRGGGLRSV